MAAGGMRDHVHLLLSLHPQTSVSDIMRLATTNSSKWVHETYMDNQAFGWQDWYAAFSVSASNVQDVKGYIADQQRRHARLSFDEEFRAFIDSHGVAYDERYLLR